MGKACLFCDHRALQPNILRETANFRLVCDAFPLTEGHLLIMPVAHAQAFGGLAAHLDRELLMLKEEARRFLVARYMPPVFFEHGVIGQTVGHAHLHALPTGLSLLPLLREQAGFTEIHGPPALRRYFEAYGRYFYYEEGGRGYATVPRHARPGELHILFAGV